MKYFKNCPTLVIVTLYAILILGNSYRLIAQEDVYINVARFSIVIETSGDDIKLTCNEGCAWKELSFSSSIKGEPQGVDQYGMTTLPRNLIKKDLMLSNFLFTIKKTQEGISLEGKEGTAWPTLDFVCTGGKCFKPIDGWGVHD